MKHYIMAFIALSMLFIACNKQPVTSPDIKNNLLKIAQATMADGRIISIYSSDSLKTGYNPIFIDVSENGTAQSGAFITLSTLMDMGDMKHSSPSVPPLYNSEIKLYEAAVVFTMPSSSKEWSLIFSIDGIDVSFNLDVKLNKNKTVGVYTALNNEVYVVALYPHSSFRVGMNPFFLFISKKETPMRFTPVTGLSIDFRPEMTSMGHGSPGNKNPQDGGGGFYHGTVNYTMTGDWRLNFNISKNEQPLFENLFFDIVF